MILNLIPTPVITTVLIVLGAIILLTILFKWCYRKCPPNKVMVVTGPRGTSTSSGKARFIIPFIQRVDYMLLENIQVDFTSRDEIPTKDAINIMVDAVANMAIDQDPEVQKIAASKFLGYSTSQIQEIVTPVLEGNIREIISQTTFKELIQGDKKVFAERVTENVSPNLRDMGLKLTTFNIQNFSDQNGVIQNLGIENVVQISKDAAKAKAAAEAEIAIAKADANKVANDAQVAAETEIAQKQNELAIKKAELQKEADIKRAEAAAAHDIEAENQRKTQEVATANANLARQEKEIELKEREVTIKERQLEAEIKKTAEAQKYATQQQADAQLYATQRASEAELFERQKQAEAEKFEAEQQAAAQKALAEAIKAEGLAQAAAEEAKGKAEAIAIQAKAEAEAEGLMKKAEALKQYGEAAREQQKLDALKVYFEQLPAIAKAVGEGYTNVESIKMFGGETSQLAGDIMKNVTQVTDGLSESLGIDVKALLSSVVGGRIAAEANEPVAVVPVAESFDEVEK